MQTDLKVEARQIFEAGLRAVDPIEAIKRFLRVEGSRLRCGEQEFDLVTFDRVWALGAGKASAAMAQAVEEVIGDRVSGGLVIVKYDHLAPLEKIRLREAGHPTPDENGWRATQQLAEMAEKLTCRKQAVQLYYYQHLTKAEICRRLGRSRPWLDRWLTRYDPDDVAGSLSDRKAGPKRAKGHWSAAIRQQVLEMRRTRSQQPYALIGAEAIHFEMFDETSFIQLQRPTDFKNNLYQVDKHLPRNFFYLFRLFFMTKSVCQVIHRDTAIAVVENVIQRDASDNVPQSTLGCLRAGPWNRLPTRTHSNRAGWCIDT